MNQFYQSTTGGGQQNNNGNGNQFQQYQQQQQQFQQYSPSNTNNNNTTTTTTTSTSKKGKNKDNQSKQQQQQIQQQIQQQQQQQQIQQQQSVDTPSSYNGDGSDDGSDTERENKKNRNRVNQNLASRNYRQRKKEYIKEIEEKLAVLALENDQLKKENINLKKGGGVEIMKPDPAFITMMMEAKQIIIQLDVAIKKNDERSLIYLLQLFHLSIEKRHTIVEREVEKMVHPYTQAKLAAMGYVPSLENPMISSISGPSSDGWWTMYISEAQITEEQAKAIKQLRSNHWKADIELRNEREKLDRSIKEFYLNRVMVFPTNERLNKSFATNLSLSDGPNPTSPNSSSVTQSTLVRPSPGLTLLNNLNEENNNNNNSGSGSSSNNNTTNNSLTPTPNQNNNISNIAVNGTISVVNELGFSPINGNIDISEILEFTRKLEALKKNFVKQRTLMEDTHSALSSILTPKQEAMLLVRVHSSTRYDFANMEMLKNVWGSVIAKDTTSYPQPPTFSQQTQQLQQAQLQLQNQTKQQQQLQNNNNSFNNSNNNNVQNNSSNPSTPGGNNDQQNIYYTSSPSIPSSPYNHQQPSRQ
ncbi:hypothetical protein ACTFIW_010408 [Dictyostelium discoideum]